MTATIIAIMGAAQSGKTTASKHLQDAGFERMRFAGTLKNMLHTMGLTWEQLDGSEKEVPCDLLGGKTPRHAMQTIGTEWRDMIDPSLWTNVLTKEITERIAADKFARIIIDDCRFPHEVDALRKLGGTIVLIRRAIVEPGIVQRTLSKWPRWIGRIVAAVLKVQLLHPSELYWAEIEPDIEIFNNGTQFELRDTVDAVIHELLTGIPG